MPAVDFFRTVKKIAWSFATGGFGVLQVMKLDNFSFPPNVHVYLGWFFSIVTVFSLFVAGGLSAIGYSTKITDLFQKIRQISDIKSTDETLK